MPVLGVITKARSDDGFRAEAERLLPQAKNILRVLAIAETLDDGHTLEPMGMNDLVNASMKQLPEATRQAFVAAQKVSLSQKKRQARRIIVTCSVGAAAAAATPIPFADAAVLVPRQA